MWIAAQMKKANARRRRRRRGRGRMNVADMEMSRTAEMQKRAKNAPTRSGVFINRLWEDNELIDIKED